MLPYNQAPLQSLTHRNGQIASFVSDSDKNIDTQTVAAFGEEWDAFHGFNDAEIEHIGKEYFDITDSRHFNQGSIVLDVGCGSGRWSKYLSGKVKFIEAIDPSRSVFSASALTADIPNIRITQAGVDNIPFEDNSFDFVYSLGVLHHIPDTAAAMQACVNKLKPGGYFLVYLYYALENRGQFFRFIFKVVNMLRKIISRLPTGAKKLSADILALLVYWPLASISRVLKAVLNNDFYKKVPLSYYHDKRFYIMRNDALDRFGTPLEQRFTRQDIHHMMASCGLRGIVFSETPPYWHAVGQKSTGE